MKPIPIIIAVSAFIGGILITQHDVSNSLNNTQQSVASKLFGGDFTLNEKDGLAVSLSDFRGKVVVMYFGYASCPDVCPTSLAVIGSAMNSLSEKEVAHVQGILISIDPERDNGKRLKQYAKYFHQNFIGITGTPEEVKKVAYQYGSYFVKVDSESALHYLVDHTSTTFIIGRDGQFFASRPYAATAKEVADGIRAALSQSQI